LKDPFLKIASANWNLRSGIAEEGQICKQPLEIFSNQPEVTLWHNGRLLATAKVNYGKATFTVPFVNGGNKIEAVTKVNGIEIRDGAEINFLMIPKNLNNKDLLFSELNVSLGDKRIFTDSKLQQVWLPEKPYEAGSWGYIGGEIYAMKNKSRQSYGTDKNILGTEMDPIYATQRVGLKEFKLDVPDGKYAVTLHFAELVSDKEHQALAYNLDQGEGSNKDKVSERVFDVLINNEKVLEGLSNTNYLEPERAFSSKFEVEVRSGKGILVGFMPIKGEPILNGIEVLKIY
jgi:beta-galactosidase